MPVVQPRKTPTPTPARPSESHLMERGGGVVGGMHDLIEQRMAAGLHITHPLDPVDDIVTRMSRMAAYPALALSALAIGWFVRGLVGLG